MSGEERIKIRMEARHFAKIYGLARAEEGGGTQLGEFPRQKAIDRAG